MKTEIPVKNIGNTIEYDDVLCPMPECNAALHLARSSTRTLRQGDFSDGMVLYAEDTDTETWQVECAEGHVVLLPGPLGGCPYGDDNDGNPCPHEGTFDDSDDYRSFRGHDLGRLSLLVDRGVTAKL